MDNSDVKKINQIITPALKAEARVGASLKRLLAKYRSYFESLFVILLGCLAIAGWVFEIDLLKSVFYDLATMKVNTALCFILSGISLFLLQIEPQKKRYVLLARATALVVLAIGSLTLCQYLFEWDLGIDQFFINDELTAKAHFPGRMSPITALNFLLIGGSLLFLNNKSDKITRAAQWVAMLVTFLSLLSLIGYTYDVQSFYKIEPFSSVSLNTAISFFVLSIGIIFTQPLKSIVSLILEDNAAGILLRVLLPIALTVPIFIGWIRLKGQQAGYYPTEFGVALYTTANISIFVTITAIIARYLGKTENERRKDKENLAESEERLKTIIDNLNEGLIIADLDGNFLHFNRASQDLYGFENEEDYLGNLQNFTNIFELYTLDGKLLEYWDWTLPRIFRGETLKNEEFRIRRKDIDWERICSYSGKKVRDANGREIAFVTVTDITERKATTNALRQQALLIEQSSEAIFVWDFEGEIFEWNAGCETLYGFTRQEAIGRKSYELLKTKFPLPIKEFLSEMKRNDGWTGEIYQTTKGGEVLSVESRFQLTQIDGRKVVLETNRDITERKRVEAELRLEQERIENTARASPSAIFSLLMSPNDKVSFPYASPVMKELTGFAPEELIDDGSMITAGINLEDRRKLNNAFRESVSKNTVLHEIYRFQHPQKGEIWVESYAMPKPETDGSITWYGVSNDVTERKRIEEEIIESEKRYRMMFESNPLPMCVYDLETLNFLSVNDAAVHHYGYSRAEFLTMTIKDIRPSEDVPKLLESIANAPNETGKPDIGRHLKKDGTLIDVEIIAHGLLFDGKSARLVLMNDVTKRNRAEEELRFEKERLEKMAIAAPSAIYTYQMSPDGRVSIPYSSPVMEELMGFSAEELRVDCSMVFDKIHPEDVERIKESIIEAAAKSTVFRESFRYQHPQKGEIWIEAFAAPKPETDGSIMLHGVANDITERKLIEEKIIESEKRYRIMFESNPLPMWVYDLETLKFLAVNESAIIHYGYSQEEFLTKTIKDIRPPEDVPMLLSDVVSVNKKLGTPIVRRHLKKDGTLIDVEIISHGIIFAGRLSRLVLANDITERKRAERLILQMNETLEHKVVERTMELEAVNRELEAFSYSVSHDLRAPLRAMDGFSLALLEDYQDKLDKDGKNYLNRVRTGSQNMARLIDDLLKLSQMSRGELKRENVNLSNIVKEISDKLQESQPKPNVNLNIAEDVEAVVDERLMRVALENLLNNAWKFTSKKEQAEISFGQKAESGEHVYFVSDNGAGFDMSYAHKLFGAFQRLHTTKEFEGTGIGLATVQRIINRHGGQIWAESEIDKGTTFYFKVKEIKGGNDG